MDFLESEFMAFNDLLRYELDTNVDRLDGTYSTFNEKKGFNFRREQHSSRDSRFSYF